MKYKKWHKAFFLILGIVFPILIITLFAATDMGAVFNSWGKQKDGSFVYPDWRYLFLIFYKLSIYVLPPMIGVIGYRLENKAKIKKKIFLYYYIRALNFHFLILLCIKLFADSIFEFDSVLGLTLFNSIKDIQTLIGYVLTFVIKQNMKIEPGIDAKEA